MILRGSVFSQILQMDTGITVVIPDKYEEGKDYKAAYLLHGLGGGCGNWVDHTLLTLYARDYRTAFIMPEAARSFYTDMKYGQKFFTYVTEELPAICKSVFHISAKPSDTAVIGASMGGYGALKCALSKPEQYGYCASSSAACLYLKEYLDEYRPKGKWDEVRAAFGDQMVMDFLSIHGEDLQWKPENEILCLADKAEKQKEKPRIYMACGYGDYLRDSNVRFADEMKKRDFDFTFEEWEGEHGWYFFDQALKKALEYGYNGR